MKSQNLKTSADTAIEYFQLGSRLLDLGNLEESVRWYQLALEQDPDLLEAHFNLGLAYQGLACFDLAAACYRKTLQIRPEYFGALNNLGQVLARTGDLDEAETIYRQALAVNPDLADPYFNLGDLAVMRGDLETALSCYRKAIQIRPDMVAAYNNMGTVFEKQSNYVAAEKCYRKVVSLSPDLSEGYYNLGSVLNKLDRFEESVRHLEHAIELKPGYKQAYNNLALVYKTRGDLDLAKQYFSKALAIDPDFAEAHWNRSFTYLLNGDFEKGWEDFEWRFEQPKWKSLYPFRLSGPRWHGELDPDLRLLVHDEQGLGDSFQFVRYLTEVKARVGKVIFETRRSLIPLLEGFPGIDVIIERSSDGIPKAGYDSYIALMSLPYLFKTRLSSIPNGVPYIKAPKKIIADWETRFNGTGLKVGIVWAGRPEHMNDHNRSCHLNQFESLSNIPDIQWYSLQKGPAASQKVAWNSSAPLIHLGDDFDDFTDTAGAITHLDLVITVDTSVAHLAGAMGKPVWVLLPLIPDWRWMMDREDSPWYPTMRLFRQTRKGNWGAVFGRIGMALEKVVSNPLSRIEQPKELPGTLLPCKPL